MCVFVVVLAALLSPSAASLSWWNVSLPDFVFCKIKVIQVNGTAKKVTESGKTVFFQFSNRSTEKRNRFVFDFLFLAAGFSGWCV